VVCGLAIIGTAYGAVVAFADALIIARDYFGWSWLGAVATS